MSSRPEDAIWLDEHHECTSIEIIERSGMTEAELLELVECGVLTPLDPQASPWRFSASCLAVARDVHRLRCEFEVESGDLGLLAVLLDRIRALEAELEALRARQPGWPL
jgi:chaperone modulatory protein CbpM